jgi:hypothetical protein
VSKTSTCCVGLLGDQQVIIEKESRVENFLRMQSEIDADYCDYIKKIRRICQKEGSVTSERYIDTARFCEV